MYIVSNKTSEFKIRETHEKYIVEDDIYKQKGILMVYRMGFLWRSLEDDCV